MRRLSRGYQTFHSLTVPDLRIVASRVASGSLRARSRYDQAVGRVAVKGFGQGVRRDAGNSLSVFIPLQPSRRLEGRLRGHAGKPPSKGIERQALVCDSGPLAILSQETLESV
jgi:hypothetical protein